MLQNFTRLLFLLIIIPLQGQRETSYNQLENEYGHYREGDSRAIPLVQKSIEKATALKDDIHLFYAYQDAIYFSEKTEDKLTYANASIRVANKIKQRDLIATAYLSKGVIINKREQKYSRALRYFLKADSLLNDSKNLDLKYQIKYHIGKLKVQLLQYEEALMLFSETEDYFRGDLNENSRPEQAENNKRGLLNSLNQQAICNIKLSKFNEASKILTEGVSLADGNLHFAFEKELLQLTKGILFYHKGNYKGASTCFKEIDMRNLLSNDDYAVSLLIFYHGSTYSKLGLDELAYQKFRKLDSFSEKKGIETNELRFAYQYLLGASEITRNSSERDRIYKALERIERKLFEEQINLHSESYKSSNRYYLSSSRLNSTKNWQVFLFLTLGLIVWYLNELRKVDNVNFSTEVTGVQYATRVSEPEYVHDLVIKEREVKYNESATKEILSKLEDFKKRKGYLKKGITIEKLARKMGTNRTRLSYVLNSVVGCGFTDYINRLRIEYIIEKIQSEPKYLLYTIEALGDEAGFASRQSFSDQFKNIAGIRPTDFIKSIKCTGNA